nr:hypothetical protein Cduv_386 [Cedratvirus duvanny]
MTTRCIEAVKKGDLEELKRLAQAGHPLNKVIIATSLAHEHYHIFEWAKNQGCDTMGVEVRYYKDDIMGVGKTDTLNRNERRYGFTTA